MTDKPTIKIGHLRITDHLILGITEYKLGNGDEKFEHFNLSTVPTIGWNGIAEGMSNGELDGAFMLAPLAMDLFKSGEPIKLILFGHKNGSILIKNNAANISEIEDFKGKSVIIPYQLSVHNMLFHKLLSEKGLEIGVGKDVVLEVMAPSQIPQAMQFDEEGEIGGFIVAEPFGSHVVKAGFGEELALSKEIWPNHPCCVFVIKDEIIQNHPEAVQELTNSLVQSGKFIEENPKEAAKMGVPFLNQDMDVLEKVLTEPPDRITTGELMPVIEDLDEMQKYMADKMGAVTGRIDVEKFVDKTFAEKAGAK